MFKRGGRIASSTRRALIILPIWAASVVWLWSWWFSRTRAANLYLFIPLTLAIFYEYVVVPSAFLFFILKAKAPKKRRPLLGKKVAVVTPCVPAQESMEIIEKQLKAMSEITYLHDSWILDEGGNKTIKQLARQYGVNYFTRKGVAKYNLGTYPFKAKSKAGNINAWLDKVKRHGYDFFVQLDIDHIPKPEYLDKTLGHFRDMKVGWVQAPSVYSNLEHWTARGSAEQEQGLQGPLQMGFYSISESPVIIGSHTTFRMQAIREIDGFQPTRAEDHLNTLALMGKGWKGVYLPEIIAEGDGPETLNAYLSQQYAWSFSMFQILKTYSLPHLKSLSLKQKLQYIFIETWYPLWSLSFCVMFLVPIAGLLFNTSAINSTNDDFLFRFSPAIISILLMWWAGRPLFQPKNIGLSWRGIVLHVIRWPVALAAIASAGLGRVKPYQITPKGKFLRNVPTVKLYRPFLLLSILSAVSMLFWVFRYGKSETNGLLVFATTNLVTMLTACVVDLNIRLRQVRFNPKTFKKYWLKPVMAVSSTMLVASIASITALSSSQQTLYALLAPRPTLTAISPQQPKDISNIPPQLLTDDELATELASHRFVHNGQVLPSIGLHNPKAPLPDTEPYIRHTFVDWREDRKLGEELLITLRGGNTPLVTIEPKGELDGAKLLNDIQAGRDDQIINKFLNVIGGTDSTVYVRFAHEMDLANVYPWGDQDAQSYIAAYRHVTDMAKSKGIKNIKWVWGPGGTAGAFAYYPGDDVVDVIGTTMIYDLPSFNAYQFSFYDIANNRLHLLGHGKPVWITEFGAGNTNPDYQKKLTEEAVAQYKEYGFAALIYINIPDSNLVNGPNYEFSDAKELIQVLGLAKTPKLVETANEAPKINPLAQAETDRQKPYLIVSLPKQ
ncbi:MAG TPA: glycosyltransferase family 2 protein [Candidatus Saccharimonadales bacterium]|nr:glycosyltransferase family 2 protein [Candidatus Saccharimonadales bacterium]